MLGTYWNNFSLSYFTRSLQKKRLFLGKVIKILLFFVSELQNLPGQILLCMSFPLLICYVILVAAQTVGKVIEALPCFIIGIL